MDGNGRWAEKRGKPRRAGHLEGVKAAKRIVRAASAAGLRFLTLYTFSTENWSRPGREVTALMAMLRDSLRAEREELRANNVRLQVIGRLDDLSAAVRRSIQETEDFLASCTGMLLVLAISYSGRAELVDAIRRIVADRPGQRLTPGDVDDELVASYLYTAGLPDPDLLIRTSGEMRISNFMLWQLAYTELWITDTLWPDFRRRHLYQAIADYQGRERRFGRVD